MRGRSQDCVSSRQHGVIKRGALAQLRYSRALVATSQSLLDGRRVTHFFLIGPPARISHSFYKHPDQFGSSSPKSPQYAFLSSFNTFTPSHSPARHDRLFPHCRSIKFQSYSHLFVHLESQVRFHSRLRPFCRRLPYVIPRLILPFSH